MTKLVVKQERGKQIEFWLEETKEGGIVLKAVPNTGGQQYSLLTIYVDGTYMHPSIGRELGLKTYESGDLLIISKAEQPWNIERGGANGPT